MLADGAIFLCLLVMLVALLRRKARLTHVRYGSNMLTAGMLILTVVSFIDLLFIGNFSVFKVGLSGDKWTQIWILCAFTPGLIILITGLVRLLPAISELNDQIIARKKLEAKQQEQYEELRLAKQRAERAEHTLMDAIESLPDPVAVYDENERLVIHNRSFSELFACIEDILVPGTKFEEILHTLADRRCIKQAIGREQEWIDRRLHEHRNSSGPIEQEFDTGQVFRLWESEMKSGGMVCIRSDITQLRERERALEENRAKLEEAQSVAHIGNWMHDSNYQVYEWSDEIYRILGYKPDEVLPTYENYLKRVHPDDIEMMQATVAEVRNMTSDYEVKYRVLYPSGEVIYVREVGRFCFDDNGNPSGVVGTLQNVTAQHLVEEELIFSKQKAEEGTRSKSLFLANMSHELRTPLNAVIGFSEVLAKEIFGPIQNPKYREYADNIQSSGKHLLSLIDDILDYSRLESGTLKLQETEFNLFDLAHSTRTMLAAKAIEKSIEFVISKDTDVLINGDERKLKQVLINLINNAIKFTPENGKIGLKVSTNAGNYISIFIEDNGYGISEDEIEDVMRPFGRAYHSVTKSIEGTGLGLPLSKSIIELHGGELKIAGNNNKAGTTVEIRLPKTRLRQCA